MEGENNTKIISTSLKTKNYLQLNPNSLARKRSASPTNCVEKKLCSVSIIFHYLYFNKYSMLKILTYILIKPKCLEYYYFF